MSELERINMVRLLVAAARRRGASIFKLELSNKERDGRVVGNLWGIGAYTADYRRMGYVLPPQGSEALSRKVLAVMCGGAKAA